MRYVARLQLVLPGNDPADAEARLRRVLPPGWDFTVERIEPAAEQPPPVTGTLTINLPGVAPNGR